MAAPARRTPSTPHEWLELAWRRRWVIAVPLVLIGGAALFLAARLPPVYRASTVILVERPEVPEEYVKSLVTTRIEDRLATINQQILSRTRLESIIRDLDLYREERARQPMDAVIDGMRGAIEMQVRRSDSFTIYFRGRNPATVRDVTNRLAALYIEENSKVREERAAGTAQFLESQLAALKDTLAEHERKVREFQERNLGELPQQQEANLRQLDRLQLQVQSLNDQVRGAEDRKLLLQVQLGQLPRTQRIVTRTLRSGFTQTIPLDQVAPLGGTAAPEPRDPIFARLDEARAALLQLQARYREEHPDVIRQRRVIEELETQIAGIPARVANPTTAPSQTGAPAPSTSPVTTSEEVREVPNPLYAQVEAQILTADRESAALRQSIAQITERIRALQEKVENVPQVEQQLKELTRDYENTQRAYGQLLSKKLEAQLAENLERRQKGEQFRVLDPAVVPEVPHRPHRPLIAGSGLALGAGLGIGLAYLLEVLDRAVRGAREVRAVLPSVPLLGAVPLILAPVQARRRRLRGAGLAVLASGLGVLAVLGAARYGDQVVRASLFELFLR